MTNPNALYEDMEKLNALFEQLGWPHDDPLTFLIEGDKIVIRNLFQEQREKPIRVCEGHPLDNT